jgi:hypothetical protein
MTCWSRNAVSVGKWLEAFYFSVEGGDDVGDEHNGNSQKQTENLFARPKEAALTGFVTYYVFLYPRFILLLNAAKKYART